MLKTNLPGVLKMSTHFYGLDIWVSSWGWGSKIFEITHGKEVFKYLVPNLTIFRRAETFFYS